MKDSTLLTVFRMQVFFTNLSLMEFQVSYLALFLLFLVIDGFAWFGMGILHKNIRLILEFLKVPFLVLHLWLLNLNLIYKTIWSGAGSDLLISMLEKLSWFLLTGLITLVLLCENGWPILEENYLLRCWVDFLF